MGCTCEQKQQEGPPAKAVELPTTGYSFISPYIEDYSRRILGSRGSGMARMPPKAAVP